MNGVGHGSNGCLRRERRPTKRAAVRLMAGLVLVAMLGAPSVRGADAPLPVLARVEKTVAAAIRAAHARVAHDDADSWGDYGLTLDAHGFDAEAIVCYERAASGSPDYRWYARWGALSARGSTDSAIEHLDRAHQLNPDDVALAIDLADLLLRRGAAPDRDRVRGLLERAADRATGLDAVITATRLAQLSLANRDLERARSLVEVHARARVPHRDIYVVLAQADPRQHEKWTALARGYPRKQARSSLRATLASLDVSTDAQLDRVHRLIDQGRFDLAASLLALLGDETPVLITRAELARERANGEALRLFEAVLRQSPGNAQALLALVELEALVPAAAIERAHPGSSRDARKAHAELYVRSGDVVEALIALRGLLLEDSTDHDVARRIAALEWRVGDTKAAQTRWQALVDRFPDDVATRRALVHSAWWLGDPRAAIDHATRLFDVDASSGRLFIRLITATDVSTEDERRLALEMARGDLARQRRDPTARLNYAAASLGAGRFTRAARQSETLVDSPRGLSASDVTIAMAIRDAARDELRINLPWPFEGPGSD